jgi:hypothetical protein
LSARLIFPAETKSSADGAAHPLALAVGAG